VPLDQAPNVNSPRTSERVLMLELPTDAHLRDLESIRDAPQVVRRVPRDAPNRSPYFNLHTKGMSSEVAQASGAFQLVNRLEEGPKAPVMCAPGSEDGALALRWGEFPANLDLELQQRLHPLTDLERCRGR
jgi:hypothetical protein